MPTPSPQPRTATQKPWYQHGYLWLVIALPILSVMVSLSFVKTAFDHQADIVRDDWYKDGKAVEQDMSRDTVAAHANLHAKINIDATGSVDVRLNYAPNTAIPPELNLYFFHPIKASKDHTIPLQRLEDGHYQGKLDAELLKPSNYHVELDGHLWRLRGRVELPVTAFELAPLPNLIGK